jgi:hypothetical protein
MPTLADSLRERVAARRAEREFERINNPRRYAARQRAEAYRDRNCPLRIIKEEVVSSLKTISEGVTKIDLSQSSLPEIHVQLSSFAETLKRLREPIKNMDQNRFDAALGAQYFGGDLPRYSVYHLLDRHRRGTCFTPLVQQFLADYNAARQQDRTLTREKFFETYADQILNFLLNYKLIERPTTNEARIEFMTLRFLVAAVLSAREKYPAESMMQLIHEAKIDAVCKLAREAEARFLALDNAEIKQAVEQGGFNALLQLQRERQAYTNFKPFKIGDRIHVHNT